jgi:hypothetical protein
LEYDWSDPRRVVLNTIDSNAWANTCTHTYTLTPQPDGMTDIDVVIVRHGKNVKGHVFAGLFAIAGKQIIGRPFHSTIKAIEARNYGATPKPA